MPTCRGWSERVHGVGTGHGRAEVRGTAAGPVRARTGRAHGSPKDDRRSIPGGRANRNRERRGAARAA